MISDREEYPPMVWADPYDGRGAHEDQSDDDDEEDER